MKAKLQHNVKMQEYLAAHGLPGVSVKLLLDGSMRGCWRIYDRSRRWGDDLRQAFTDMGFTGFDGRPISEFAGNGGDFQVFLRHPRLTAEFCTPGKPLVDVFAAEDSQK